MLERENRESARDFMLKNFYKIAVIPKSVQLAETLDKFPYLNDELGKRIFNCNVSYSFEQNTSFLNYCRLKITKTISLIAFK
jgi:hypothetical protein